MDLRIVIPYEDLLIKAVGSPGHVSPAFGNYGNMPIIAIGPRGGKIVGYGKFHKPIYAHSVQAKNLALIQTLQDHPNRVEYADKLVAEWLLNLGIEGKMDGTDVVVDADDAALISEALGVISKPGAEGRRVFNRADLLAHVGQPLRPQQGMLSTWAAEAASGQAEDETWPKDLNKLKVIGKAGSHAILRLQDTDGRIYWFKPGDPKIMRAEEAAGALGRLIVGPHVPAAKVVEVNGKNGALYPNLEGEPFNAGNHSDPPEKYLDKYRKQIVQQEVVDWLTANHDAHAGNFLANGGELNGIDKGQAWKWIGKDSLDPDFKGAPGDENPSLQIYSKFWKLVKDGTISSEGLEDAVNEALKNVESISDEQFQSIVTPYLEEQSHNQKKMYQMMLDRLHSMRSDFTQFFSEQLPDGGKILSEGAGASNAAALELVALAEKQFQAGQMKPEEVAEVKKVIETLSPEKVKASLEGIKEKLKAKEALKVIEGGKEEAPKGGAPVWPITKGSGKGSVTVVVPGDPPPEGWPEGVPGPGYRSENLYKGKKYNLTIYANEKGIPGFEIEYPDGTTRNFSSLNAAGDSLYLFDHGFELGMTATEKKAKHIALGSQVFKFKQFEEELKAAHALKAALSSIGKAVEELEQEGTVSKEDEAVPAQPEEKLSGKWEPPPLSGKWEPAPKEPEFWSNLPTGTVVKDAVAAEGSTQWIWMRQPNGKWVAIEGGTGTQYSAKEFIAANMTDWEIQKPKSLQEGFLESWAISNVFSALQAGSFPTKANLGDLPIGTKFSFSEQSNVSVQPNLHTIEKMDDGTYEQTVTWPDGNVTHKHYADVELVDALESVAPEKLATIQVFAPGETPEKSIPAPEEKKAGGGWKETGSLNKDEMQAYVPGQKIKVHFGEDSVDEYTKQEDGFWQCTDEAGEVSSCTPGFVSKMTKTGSKVEVFVSSEPAPEEGSALKVEGHWYPHISVSGEMLTSYPVGTQLKYKTLTGKEVLATKQPSGSWHWPEESEQGVNVTAGMTAEGFAEHLKYTPTLVNTLDAEKVIAEADAKIEQWVSGEGAAPEKPVGNWKTIGESFQTIPYTVFSGFKTGQKVKFSGEGKEEIWTKQADGNWQATVEGHTGVQSSTYLSQFSAHSKVEVELATVKKRVPPGVHFDASTLPESMAPFVDTVVSSLAEWKEMSQAGAEHNQIEKSPLWPGWAPPPGVFLEGTVTEGEDEGKKFFFTSSMVGWNKSGTEPGKKYWCTLFTSEGQGFHAGSSSKMAIKALQAASGKAGLKLDAKGIKKLFNLNKLSFAPTDTYYSVQSGESVASLPTVKEATGSKHPADMTPEEKATPVQKTVSLIDALQEAVKTTPLSDGVLQLFYEDQVSGHPGCMALCYHEGSKGSSKAKYDEFQKLLATFGLPGGDTHTTMNGFTAFIPTEHFQKDVPVSMPAGKAASTPDIATDEEWEAGKMPWGISKVLNGASQSQEITLKVLKNCPDGTIIGPVGDVYFQKNSPVGPWKKYWPDGHYVAETSPAVAAMCTFSDSIVMHPPGSATIEELMGNTPKPKPIKYKAPKPDPNLAKKMELAKKVSEWAKTNKPVTGAAELAALSYFQKSWPEELPGMKVWARQDGDNLLLGSEHAALGDYLSKALGYKPETVESPLGSFWKVPVKDLQEKFPSDPVKGPDEKFYPHGTTFKDVQVTHSVADLLKPEEGYHKIAEHKSPKPGFTVLKVSPAGKAGLASLEAMVKKFDLHPEGKVVTGSQNVIAVIPQTDLDKMITETVHEPQIPEQPKAFIPASLPSVQEKDHTPAYNNRADLGIIDSIKTPALGHWIRYGKAGVLRNFQLMAQKVKDTKGNMFYEFSGTLCKFPEKNKLSDGTVVFRSCSGKEDPATHEYIIDYDPETGAATETTGVLRKHEGLVGKTTAGSEIALMPPQSVSRYMNNTFRVRVKEGANTESELHEAFQRMGVDAGMATAVPDDDDERMFIKSQILRMAEGATTFGEEDFERYTTDEKWVDSRLKELGVAKYVAGAKIERAFNGKHVVVLDDAAEIKKAGVLYCYIGCSSDMGYIHALTKQGYASRKVRYLAGCASQGASPMSDEQKGGGIGAYSRIARAAGEGGWGYRCNPQGSGCTLLLFHPRVLQRTDVYIHNGDNHGTTMEGSTGKHQNLKVTDSCNEALFEDGLSGEDLIGMTAASEGIRKQLIERFHKQGVEEINGIPVEKFVITYHGDNKASLGNKIYGLKEPGE